MSEYTCPWCALHPEIWDGCPHNAQQFALAEAIRDGIDAALESPADWGTPDDIAGGFLDDAEGLYPEVGEPPYRVRVMYPKPERWVMVGIVNERHLFAIPNEEGDAPAEYLADIAGFIPASLAPAETKGPNT